MAATFDTLKFAETLKSAGLPEKEAKALTEALTVAFQEGAGQLATKPDILELNSKIDRLEERTEGQFDALEERTKGRFTLLQWMVAFNLALTVAVLWMLIRS